MSRRRRLDEQWEDLMSMCVREKHYRTELQHPKLLAFLTARIDELAGEMGFSAAQIKRREFRATKVDGHIADLLTE